jgi:spermidine synthase
MGALGAEVVWTRVLSLLLGATVYTFSIILAVFLVGLGLGSSVGSFVARRAARPRLWLGVCQLLLTAAIAWTAYVIIDRLPNGPFVTGPGQGVWYNFGIDRALTRLHAAAKADPAQAVWYNFGIDLLRCAYALLPAAVLWGASFPLALAGVAGRGQDGGRLVGRVYAANTAGAIAGALGTSLFLIASAGTHGAQQALIALAAATALLLFVTELLRAGGAWRAVSAALAVVAALAVGLAWGVPPLPGELVAWGRQMSYRKAEGDVLYVGEGMNSSVAVTKKRGEGYINFHVAGKIEASTWPEDMRLQRLLGHVSALVHDKPRKVLVVGCGAGVTAGCFVLHPDVEKVVICEIEPLVPRVVSTYFSEENYHVVDDIARQNPHTVNGKEVEVVYDDARHFVLTTQEKFDVITSDPIHPWVKGAASLYTKEYFELCKRHLNPGGVVTQWVPLYESDFPTVRSELATFFDAFPQGVVWSNCNAGEGYDVVLLGQAEGTAIDLDAFARRLERPDHAPVAASLKAVGFDGAMGLLSTYGGWGPDLREWLEGSDINRDRNLRLQYLAGMGVNENQGDAIYRAMVAHRTFPAALFTGSPGRKAELEERVAAKRGVTAAGRARRAVRAAARGPGRP